MNAPSPVEAISSSAMFWVLSLKLFDVVGYVSFWSKIDTFNNRDSFQSNNRATKLQPC